MIVIDLRRGAGCTGHPAVRLPSLLSRYSSERELGLLFDPSEIPVEVLSRLLAGRGYTVAELHEEGGLLLAVARRGG